MRPVDLPEAPPSLQPPCGHNLWDDVGMRKGRKNLRCAYCRRTWKLPRGVSRAERRCVQFLRRGCCAEGDGCPLVHVRRSAPAAFVLHAAVDAALAVVAAVAADRLSGPYPAAPPDLLTDDLASDDDCLDGCAVTNPPTPRGENPLWGVWGGAGRQCEGHRPSTPPARTVAPAQRASVLEAEGLRDVAASVGVRALRWEVLHDRNNTFQLNPVPHRDAGPIRYLGVFPTLDSCLKHAEEVGPFASVVWVRPDHHRREWRCQGYGTESPHHNAVAMGLTSTLWDPPYHEGVVSARLVADKG
eukprot:TRINITY_DN30402_c0_g1_i1.p1 TRINITY_DN30402_c0_g1~~TRINITY_DN30402_c0_g1_i1.p1  ORF type:complete len:300 (+),score=50.06 TRINITY_DN30402_c0_g1_i1:56-955(+)